MNPDSKSAIDRMMAGSASLVNDTLNMWQDRAITHVEEDALYEILSIRIASRAANVIRFPDDLVGE